MKNIENNSTFKNKGVREKGIQMTENKSRTLIFPHCIHFRGLEFCFSYNKHSKINKYFLLCYKFKDYYTLKMRVREFCEDNYIK